MCLKAIKIIRRFKKDQITVHQKVKLNWYEIELIIMGLVLALVYIHWNLRGYVKWNAEIHCNRSATCNTCILLYNVFSRYPLYIENFCHAYLRGIIDIDTMVLQQSIRCAIAYLIFLRSLFAWNQILKLKHAYIVISASNVSMDYNK